jgi:hypothetical protein
MNEIEDIYLLLIIAIPIAENSKRVLLFSARPLLPTTANIII